RRPRTSSASKLSETLRRARSSSQTPFNSSFESGGRSYGGKWGSSPISVTSPEKPWRRRASAARSPAREAPTTAIRFIAADPAAASSTSDSVDDRDHVGRAPKSGVLDLRTELLAGVLDEHFHERLVVHAEHLGRGILTLRVPGAKVEVDDDLHRSAVSFIPFSPSWALPEPA